MAYLIVSKALFLKVILNWIGSANKFPLYALAIIGI